MHHMEGFKKYLGQRIVNYCMIFNRFFILKNNMIINNYMYLKFFCENRIQ